MTAKAVELRAAGVDVISLSAGEPDFTTPEHIVEAAARAMHRGETRYTAVDGTAAVKKAVAAKFLRENGIDYTASEITVSAGAKQVIYNAFMATLAPGSSCLPRAGYPISTWCSLVKVCRSSSHAPNPLDSSCSRRRLKRR